MRMRVRLTKIFMSLKYVLHANYCEKKFVERGGNHKNSNL